MFDALRQLFTTRSTKPAPSDIREAAPREVMLKDGSTFPLFDHRTYHTGFPLLDWKAAQPWIEAPSSEELTGQAWDACGYWRNSENSLQKFNQEKRRKNQ